MPTGGDQQSRELARPVKLFFSPVRPRYVCVRYISPVVLPGLTQTIPAIRTRPEPLPVTVRLSRRGFDLCRCNRTGPSTENRTSCVCLMLTALVRWDALPAAVPQALP